MNPSLSGSPGRARSGPDDRAYRLERGLVNQGWKDSWDGINFADGTLAEAPITLAEVCVSGLARYGHLAAAREVALGPLDAANAFGGRIPSSLPALPARTSPCPSRTPPPAHHRPGQPPRRCSSFAPCWASSHRPTDSIAALLCRTDCCRCTCVGSRAEVAGTTSTIEATN